MAERQLHGVCRGTCRQSRMPEVAGPKLASRGSSRSKSPPSATTRDTSQPPSSRRRSLATWRASMRPRLPEKRRAPIGGIPPPRSCDEPAHLATPMARSGAAPPRTRTTAILRTKVKAEWSCTMTCTSNQCGCRQRSARAGLEAPPPRGAPLLEDKDTEGTTSPCQQDGGTLLSPLRPAALSRHQSHRAHNAEGRYVTLTSPYILKTEASSPTRLQWSPTCPGT